MDPNTFVQTMMPYAEEASRRTGIDPLVILTQAAHETGWGRAAPGNNFFGIKGAGQTFATHEYEGGQRVNQSASFRTYASPLESFLDWANLMQKPRYAAVLQARTPVDAFKALKAAGYATDPKYVAKLTSVASRISKVNPNVSATGSGPSTIRQGQKGAQVAQLQSFLNARGASLDVDGKFGPLTRAAVEAFQSANGLKVDGIVGPQTTAALQSQGFGASGDSKSGLAGGKTSAARDKRLPPGFMYPVGRAGEKLITSTGPYRRGDTLQTRLVDAQPGALLDQQRNRPLGTPPVPPLDIPNVGIPQYRPDTAIPQTTQDTYLADNLVNAVLTGDPAAVKAASSKMFGMAAPGSGVMGLKTYLEELQVKQPERLQQLAANIAGNPALLEQMPGYVQVPLREAFAAGTEARARDEVAIPGSRVPIPALRPQTAAPVPMSFAAPAAPQSFPSVWGQQPSPSRPTSAPQTSYTPFSPAPANLTGRGAGSTVPYGPPAAEPRGVLDQMGDIAGTTTDWLGGLFGGNRAAAAPARPTTSYTPFSPNPQTSYTPFSPAPPASAPPTISQSQFNERFNPAPTSYTPFSPAIPNNIPTIAPPVPQTAKTSERKMVPNPAFADYTAKVASNPYAYGMSPAPPKFIPEMVTALKRVMTAPLSFAPNTPQITVRPAGRTGQTTSSRTPTPAYSGGRATSNPYYSSSSTQGGVTVGRNSSGQTSFVRGPSGTFSVDPSRGTYTSLTTGRTFSLGL